jgi:hypothetical protein
MAARLSGELEFSPIEANVSPAVEDSFGRDHNQHVAESLFATIKNEKPISLLAKLRVLSEKAMRYSPPLDLTYLRETVLQNVHAALDDKTSGGSANISWIDNYDPKIFGISDEELDAIMKQKAGDYLKRNLLSQREFHTLSEMWKIYDVEPLAYEEVVSLLTEQVNAQDGEGLGDLKKSFQMLIDDRQIAPSTLSKEEGLSQAVSEYFKRKYLLQTEDSRPYGYDQFDEGKRLGWAENNKKEATEFAELKLKELQNLRYNSRGG